MSELILNKYYKAFTERDFDLKLSAFKLLHILAPVLLLIQNRQNHWESKRCNKLRVLYFSRRKVGSKNKIFSAFPFYCCFSLSSIDILNCLKTVSISMLLLWLVFILFFCVNDCNALKPFISVTNIIRWKRSREIHFSKEICKGPRERITIFFFRFNVVIPNQIS